MRYTYNPQYTRWKKLNFVVGGNLGFQPKKVEIIFNIDNHRKRMRVKKN